jgi:hypothetical protein
MSEPLTPSSLGDNSVGVRATMPCVWAAKRAQRRGSFLAKFSSLYCESGWFGFDSALVPHADSLGGWDFYL